MDFVIYLIPKKGEKITMFNKHEFLDRLDIRQSYKDLVPSLKDGGRVKSKSFEEVL